ncbi:DUF4352 domain-containing protein [Streptomyces sp. NRRL S-337]|uniref:DUF4352 domain-containing protein n=1 Tax=Streptomyces sp. NRRL S-337 TaxID=1463900 RepID=UPI00099BA4D3|nr:DUF4352 domain-containing protein [Streptomyces sp. NRRL S-337]
MPYGALHRGQGARWSLGDAMRPSRHATAFAIAALGITTFVAGCSSSPEAPADRPHSSVPKREKATRPLQKQGKAPVVTVGKTASYSAANGTTGARTTFSVTFHAAKYVTPSEISAGKPKGRYAVITIEVTNTGSRDGSFHPYGFMKWEGGSTLTQGVATLYSTGTQRVDSTYHPGEAVTGDIVLDVPRKGGKVSYYEGTGAASLTFVMPSK